MLMMCKIFPQIRAVVRDLNGKVSTKRMSIRHEYLTPPVISTTNYSIVFRFEDDFMYHEKFEWMVKNWKQSFWYIGIYMVFIFLGKHHMSTRPRFELRGPLVTWNICLALFSIFGAARTLPELLYALKTYGFYHSVCIPSFIENNKVSAFWTWMFILSKVPELGDTIFIVLRKQPLIFLHW
ncbi:unnamed protein product [Cyprideis torosa]|uniref:Elongation of very long chain fatty acids protein n=1 Tax=Cyprideis torosa TaxID=163714 RepID=A0A7R8W0J7_9CRUS|nr:unnamed protein product [Cyprideis torosa]CAG0879846.1 unnamed protein product [Cyprideis torosa]